jgi:putative Holliday junction resolvase
MGKNKPKENAVLGFDFGTKRIGVAVGQFVTKSASPVCVIKTKAGTPNWEKIKSLKNEWNVDAFVVGIPYNMDGSEQAITKSAQQFGYRLKKLFKMPVYFVDERLTTKEALWSLKQSDKKKQLQYSKNIDSLAAKIILESFLRSTNKGEACE